MQSTYGLAFMPEALAEWHALDGSVKATLKKSLAKRLVQPHQPGSRLNGELGQCYKIKLLKHGYRLVYTVEEEMLVVLVIAIDRRADNDVYRSALRRFMNL